MKEKFRRSMRVTRKEVELKHDGVVLCWLLGDLNVPLRLREL